MLRANTLIFDLWYTLVCPEDSRRCRQPSSRQIPALLGFDTSHFAAYWASCEDQIYRDGRSLELLVRTYASSVGVALSPDDLVAFDRIWQDHDQALANPRPAILQGLDALRTAGFRLGLLSNAHEREMRSWPDSPLARRFDTAAFSFRIGARKPAPEAYQRVLANLGASPALTVFVGDGASQELLGAQRAGLGGCVHQRGLLRELEVDPARIRALSDQADIVIDDLSELPQRIRFDGAPSPL